MRAFPDRFSRGQPGRTIYRRFVRILRSCISYFPLCPVCVVEEVPVDLKSSVNNDPSSNEAVCLARLGDEPLPCSLRSALRTTVLRPARRGPWLRAPTGHIFQRQRQFLQLLQHSICCAAHGRFTFPRSTASAAKQRRGADGLAGSHMRAVESGVVVDCFGVRPKDRSGNQR